MTAFAVVHWEGNLQVACPAEFSLPVRLLRDFRRIFSHHETQFQMADAAGIFCTVFPVRKNDGELMILRGGPVDQEVSVEGRRRNRRKVEHGLFGIGRKGKTETKCLLKPVFNSVSDA